MRALQRGQPMPVNPISCWSAPARGGFLLVGLAASLAVGAAQDPPVDPPAATQAQEQAQVEQPGVLTGEDVAQGVFVRDSAIAVDQFALAERMERLRDWTKAADVYQEVVGKFGDLLIADRADANGKVYQYASVGRAVQRKLAAWPPEGRAVYEQKFGAAARTLLDQAMQASPADDEQLQKVVRLYFVTDAGREAAVLLIDRHLADGSFAAARRLSREVLEMHPALGEQRPEVLLRGAIAAHFLGDAEKAAEYAQELSEQFPQAKAAIAGEERVVADVAKAILESPPRRGIEVAGDGWPTFGGSDDRSRLAHPLSSQIAPYVQDIRVPETRPGDQPLNASLKRDIENARQNG